MTRSRRILFAFLAFGLVGIAAAWRLFLRALDGRVLQLVALEPGMHVVDVGCGAGRLTTRIAKEVGPTGNVVGLDINPKALRAAERHAHATGLENIHFVLAGAGEGKLGQTRFDRAVLVAVLGEIIDRDAAMYEIFQALKPGGLLSVTEVALDPHRRSGNEVRLLARAAGFVEQSFVDNRLLFTINLVKPPFCSSAST